MRLVLSAGNSLRANQSPILLLPESVTPGFFLTSIAIQSEQWHRKNFFLLLYPDLLAFLLVGFLLDKSFTRYY